MIAVFFSVCLVLFITIAVIFKKNFEEKMTRIGKFYNRELRGLGMFYVCMLIILGILTITFFIWAATLTYEVGTGITIEQKISMYEAENARIEESIDTLVKSYMKFESSTYIDLKDDDAINLVTLFPELKSDDLVQQQMAVYIKNNQKIKELKEQQIDLQKAKWQLYFGR